MTMEQIKKERIVINMNLFLNSPEYYTEEYGVNDDIYKFYSMISQNIDITLYTDYLDTIGIVPIIAPESVLREGLCKEVKRISIPYRMAAISLVSDYNSFIAGDIIIKKQIILENILRSLKVIKSRLKGKFDYEKMEQDIKKLISTNPEDI